MHANYYGIIVEYHLKIEADLINAVDLLSQTTELSKQSIKLAMQKGAVWLTTEQGTQRMRRHSRKLKIGWELHFYYNPDVLNKTVAPAELVADEKSYSIWNKPYGMLSQGSKWSDHCTLYRWAEKNLQPERPSFIVHRLDRAANGLMIVAHSKKMAAKFSKMFAEREIVKKYRASVSGQFEVKEVKTEYTELMPYNTRVKITEPVDDKQACSYVELLEYKTDDDTSTLIVEIESGRKHQIRKHLASIGFPVLGDRLYGGALDESQHMPDLQLTAFYLSFKCPETLQEKTWQLD